MKKKFNQKDYLKLKHRIEALLSRVQLDVGPEQETAKRLLIKIEKKLKVYEETHEIPEQLSKPEDYSKTTDFDFDNSFWNDVDNSSDKNAWDACLNFKWHVHYENHKKYYEDNRSEEEMINDLGILYAILGSTYETVLNYHVYKIRFKKQTSNNNAFYRVYADIYEDNIKICNDIIIGFWPFHFGNDRCGDMEFSSMNSDSIDKYINGCSILYITLLDRLMNIWNFYFDNQNVPMLTGPILNYIESNDKTDLNSEQRKTIIDQTENKIDSGKMKSFEYNASTLEIMAYKPFHFLSDFLEESGVVYKIESSGVYIWNHTKKSFEKLVGYKYEKPRYRYILYLV